MSKLSVLFAAFNKNRRANEAWYKRAHLSQPAASLFALVVKHVSAPWLAEKVGGKLAVYWDVGISIIVVVATSRLCCCLAKLFAEKPGKLWFGISWFWPEICGFWPVICWTPHFWTPWKAGKLWSGSCWFGPEICGFWPLICWTPCCWSWLASVVIWRSNKLYSDRGESKPES